MPYIKAQVSSSDILQAVEQMPPAELEEFLQKVATIHARRKAKGLSHAETELLHHINNPLPQPTLTRYRELIALRRQEQLTTAEHVELLQLSDALEDSNTQRMGWLADLARLRGSPLLKVMNDLGIKPQPYG